MFAVIKFPKSYLCKNWGRIDPVLGDPRLLDAERGQGGPLHRLDVGVKSGLNLQRPRVEEETGKLNDFHLHFHVLEAGGLKVQDEDVVVNLFFGRSSQDPEKRKNIYINSRKRRIIKTTATMWTHSSTSISSTSDKSWLAITSSMA